MKLDAWTSEALADAVGVGFPFAERVLEEAAAAGEVTRISSGSSVLFVLGSLLMTVEALENVTVVEGDVLAERRQRARRIRVGQRLADVDVPKPKKGKKK